MLKRIIILLIVVALAAGIFFGIRYFLNSTKQQGLAGLYVKSNPTASIFLDTRFLGRTPYQEKLDPGEYTLKLIPESTATTAASWQGKVVLTPNILTYVNRELGISDLASSGEVITLERISGKETEVTVTTVPDGASVTINGEDKGTAPITLKNIEPGDHEIVITSPGFITRSVNVKATIGFRVLANIQLGIGSEGSKPTTPQEAEVEEATKSAVNTQTTPTPTKKPSAATTLPKPYVEILDTPTGWLRVRSSPSTQASESGRVNPTETYPLLEEESGWYKIEVNGKVGWISGTYAQKFE